jgi:hypothetical protein
MTGPYQSRFLNLITHHYRRWRDEMQRTVRQGTTATVWTMQAVLFPFYAAAQAGRTLRQRLQPAQSANTVQPNGLPGGSSDAAIQNTLKALPELESTLELVEPKRSLWQRVTQPMQSLVSVSRGWLGAPQRQIPETPDVPQLRFTFTAADSPLTEIRGLASECETRSLVLVTVQNQILDVLNAEQQRHLQQRFIQELTAQPEPPAIAPATPPAPVRWLNHAIVWMQQSPVAIAANLFGESSTALPPLPPAETATPSVLQSVRSWMMANVPKPGAIVLTASEYELWDNTPTQSGSSASSNSAQATGAIASLSRLPLPYAAANSSAIVRTDRRTTPFPKSAPPPSFTSAENSLLDTDEWDGIDIDAQTLNYVKHPLEQVLEWLDRALLWLEGRLARLGQWMQRWIDRLSR